MNLKSVLASAIILASSHAALAAIHVNQTWDTGGGPNLNYYISSGDASYTSATDPVLNTGNANQIVTATASGPRIMSSTFSAASLVNTGDVLTYSMSFHFPTVFSASAGYTPSLRLGIYNSNGTPVTTGWSAGSTQSNNDYGYSISLGMNSPSVTVAGEYKNISTGAMDFNTNQDTLLSNATSATFAGVNNTSAHNVSLQLTKTATGLAIAVILDGQTIFTGVDNSANAVTSFDCIEFGVFNNWKDAWQLNVDNIRVETTPIPEPAAISLLAAGSIAVLASKHRGFHAPVDKPNMCTTSTCRTSS